MAWIKGLRRERRVVKSANAQWFYTPLDLYETDKVNCTSVIVPCRLPRMESYTVHSASVARVWRYKNFIIAITVELQRSNLLTLVHCVSVNCWRRKTYEKYLPQQYDHVGWGQKSISWSRLTYIQQQKQSTSELLHYRVERYTITC